MSGNPLKKAQDAEKQHAATAAAGGDDSDPEMNAPKNLTLQEKLDLLDKRIVEDEGINIANVDSVRSYVQAIMIDLKEQPELDSILIDRDVHNILAYIQEDRTRAVEANAEKKEKTAKKAASKSKKTASLKGVDFSDLGFGGLDEISNSET